MSSGLVRFPELRKLISLSRSTIWRLERQGAFPRRRKLSSNTVGWLRSEVNVWITERVACGEKT